MTENELLELLVEELNVSDIRPDDVTATILANALGCAYSTAYSHLIAKVDKGELVPVKVKLPNGKKAIAYRRP